MTLLEEYKKQNSWRDWGRYLDMLPLTPDQSVCDLGCSIGAVTKLLAGRGKNAVGIDSDNVLLEEAERQAPLNCRFILADLQTAEHGVLEKYDGIWMSFALAYMREPVAFISSWMRCLKPGGWFALTDIDSLFSCHLPKDSRFLAETIEFERKSEQSGFYNDRIGRKLKPVLMQNGLEIIVEEDDWYDLELNFTGAAPPEIALNWEARLARMISLKAYFGDRYGDFCREFMSAIASADHEAHGGVRFCVGIKMDEGV